MNFIFILNHINWCLNNLPHWDSIESNAPVSFSIIAIIIHHLRKLCKIL